MPPPGDPQHLVRGFCQLLATIIELGQPLEIRDEASGDAIPVLPLPQGDQLTDVSEADGLREN